MRKLKLLLAAAALFGVSATWAQSDVTATYLTNAGFDDCTAATSDVVAKTINDYSSAGWTNAGTGGFTTIAVTAYGGEVKVGSSTTPSTKKDETTVSGNTLGIIAGWGDNVTIQSDEIILPAGFYTLTVDHYLTSATENYGNTSSKFGFVTSGGSYLVSSTAFTASTWTTETVTFNLTEPTTGKIQIGLSGLNKSGSGSPAVFYDDVTLTWTDPLKAAKDALQAEIDKASLCDAKEGLATAISTAEDVLNNATTTAELEEALTALQAADKDAVLRYDNGLANATYADPVVTSFVVNGTFDSNVNGWQHTAEVWSNNIASNQYGAFTGNYYENWDGTAKVNKMYQTIKNIPNGTYRLDIAAFVVTLADPNESQYVFANNDKVYLTTGNPTAYEVYTVVTNNQIEIGFEQTTATSNWMGIDNVSLRYYGAGDVINDAKNAALKLAWEKAKAAAEAARDDAAYANVTGTEKTALLSEIAKDEPTTAAGYDQARDDLKTATSKFTDAKENYDALVAEIAKAKALGIDNATADGYAATVSSTAETVAASTKELMVVEYSYVSAGYAYSVNLGAWTESNIISRTGQHWDNTPSSGYKEQNNGWSSNSWSMSMNQDLKLPAGNYILKAAGRQASGNCQLSLVVKKGDEVIGTVADFPRGDTGLGINIIGATSFDPNDPEKFADVRNDKGEVTQENVGRGFQWRYVKFTLDADATINVAVNAVGNEKYQWVSFCNATVQTDNAANISLITYNIALNNATTAHDNATYSYVGGKEKADLLAAIAADASLDKSNATEIDAAKTTLNEATDAFIAAKTEYDNFIPFYNSARALSLVANDNSTANATYVQAIEDALTETTTKDDLADNKTNLLTAVNTYIAAANPVGEGVKFDLTFMLTNPDVTDFPSWAPCAGWYTEQEGGNFQVMNNNDATSEDGTKTKFYEYYSNEPKSNNKFNLYQAVTLGEGTYTIKCYAFAAQPTGGDVKGVYFYANETPGSLVENAKLTEQSISFVNDAEKEVKIGLKSVTGNTYRWMGIGYMELYKVPAVKVTIAEDVDYTPEGVAGQVTLKRTLSTTKWNTFVVPFQITNEELTTAFGAEVAVAEYSEASVDANDATVTFTPMATPAIVPNKPVLLKPSEVNDENTYVFANRTIATGDAKVTGTNFDFVGSYAASTTIAAGDYFFNSNKLYKSTGKGSTIKGTRAYIKAKSEGARITNFVIDGEETTGIMNVEQGTVSLGKVYNMQGQQVKNAQKGIFIQNGKKVVIK